MRKQDIEILQQTALFAPIPPEMLARWIEPERVQSVNAARGEIILGGAAVRRCLIVLLKGEANVYKAGQRRVILSRLTPGSVFGMATLFYAAETAPTDVVADGDCHMLIWEKALVERMLDEYPPFAHAYIALLSERINFLNSRLRTFTEADAEQRLLRAIAGFPRDGARLTIPCSLTQLAQLLGMGRASLYRAFAVLEEQGVLSRCGHDIVVHQAELLEHK